MNSKLPINRALTRWSHCDWNWIELYHDQLSSNTNSISKRLVVRFSADQTAYVFACCLLKCFMQRHLRQIWSNYEAEIRVCTSWFSYWYCCPPFKNRHSEKLSSENLIWIVEKRFQKMEHEVTENMKIIKLIFDHVFCLRSTSN